MKANADIVIIGGGIQGTSVAYHLAKLGATNVVLLEQEMIGSGSSGRSAAMIQLQMAKEMTLRLSEDSFPEFMRFEEEFGVDIGYRPSGFLNLATESIAKVLKAQVDLQKRMNVPIEVLTPEEIGRLVPAVNTDDLVLGAICWKDGVIDPHSVMQGYVSNARRLGVKIEEGAKATAIKMEQGQVTGVETTVGSIATPTVVNAAGARAREVAQWVGVDLPIKNFKRTIFVTDRFDAVPDNAPFVMDLAVEWYFRKEGKGILMGMGTEESATPEPQLDWEYLDTMVQHALHRAPILANARVMRGWAGMRSLTPDDLPILGPVPQVTGLVNACGWGGHGVMHAPAGGRLVAEFITGRISSAGLAPFLLSRFDQGVKSEK